MIYSVNYLDLAAQINPLAFSRYLKNTGWELFRTQKNNVKIFQIETDKNFFQVNLPFSKELSDYKEAMYRAVETVSQKEDKPLREVMLYLLNPGADILKIRLDKKNIESGSILFDDAIQLYENAKKLLAATALDIIHPKKYHQGRQDDVVNKFLSECRFGQTEVGSYVVSIVCPLANLDEKLDYEQLNIFSPDDQTSCSLTRKITSRVMDNLHKIKTFIDEDNIESLYLLENEETISANFYEALAGMSLAESEVNVEFMAEWSPIIKNEGTKLNRITFNHNYYQPIQTAVKSLRKEPKTSTKIVGRIKKLESSPDVSKRIVGKITVSYLDENDKAKIVTVQLDKNEYYEAIRAHENGSFVEITGELYKEKSRTASMSCDSFVVI